MRPIAPALVLAVVCPVLLSATATPLSGQLRPVPEVATERPRLTLTGLSQAEAEEVFAHAVAAVYFARTGEVRLLRAPVPPEGERLSPSTARALTAAAPLATPATLAAFLAEVESEVATGRAGPYLLMAPAIISAPAGLRRAVATHAAPITGLTTVLSEGFETDPWSRWQRTDNTSGAFGWTTSTCDAHSGSQSADGVRGGTNGASLGCADGYVTNLQNMMVDGQCESFQGAGQAWLDVYISVSSEDGYDQLAVVYDQVGSNFSGTVFSGNLPGWWHAVFNLKQWYGIGDLTQRSCNTLGFAFISDNIIVDGWGARVDDVTVLADAATSLTCSASASPISGPAPLDVAFSLSLFGASGGAQYDWEFGDGLTSPQTNPSHRYLLPGTYNPLARITDGQAICDAAVTVTVDASGVTPTPGVYEGTTSQGKKISFTVAADGHISPYTYGYQCGSGISGESTVTTTGCVWDDGAFDCGSTSCQAYASKARIQGTFDSPTSAVGMLSVTTGSNPVSGSGCCYMRNATWSATLQGGATCSVSCSATVPASAAAGSPVAFAASATPSNCAGSPSYAWTFGDGATSSQQNPSHTYTGAGSYSWGLTVTVDGQTCTRNGTITISGGAPCTVACSTTVPDGGTAGTPVAFSASASLSNCSGSASYSWTFGDGASSTQQSPSHTYTAPGSYSWALTVSVGGTTCTANGTITITAAGASGVFMIPSVAHLPGAGGTQWRTDVAVVGNNSSAAHLTLTYHSDTQTLGTSYDLAANAAVEWRDILVSRFGLGSGASSSGVLHVESDQPVVVTSRTYNQTAKGTFGQYYPACRVSGALAYGQVGILAQLRKSSGFRTNVGIVNLGTASVSVLVRLFKNDGIQVGSSKTLTAAAGRWFQQYDIFANVGAGSNEIAYATVEVQTPGGQVWAYASVVDVATGDPTTIPVLVR